MSWINRVRKAIPFIAKKEQSPDNLWHKCPSCGQMVFTLTGDKGHPLTENEALALPRERRTEVPVGALASEPLRVPETVHLDALVAELRGGGYQLSEHVQRYYKTTRI